VLVKDLIKQVNSMPDSWVRVEEIRKIPTGLELCIAVHKTRRGRKVETWRIRCLRVREFKIEDVDGGGFDIYATTHPAARQFVAPQASLRWTGSDDKVIETVGAIYHAHVDTVDDWISFDRYLEARLISGKKFVRGPAFLLRSYAKALRAIGMKTQLTSRKNKGRVKMARPKVLHFGSSSVVADQFAVEPSAIDPKQ